MTDTTTEPVDLGLRGKALWDKILETIDANPELWNQAEWGWRGHLVGPDELLAETEAPPAEEFLPPPCGTAYCVGGWACVLSGVPLVFRLGRPHAGLRRAYGVSVAAQELLGIDADEAEELFAANNKRADLDRIAAGIWPGPS